MNKIRKILAILLLSLLLAGCSSGAGTPDPLDALRAPARMVLTGTVGTVEFSAVLTLTAAPDGGSPDARLEYVLPEALAGLCVVREGGVWGASLGEVTFSGDAAAALGLPAAAFFLRGDPALSGTDRDDASGEKGTVFSLETAGEDRLRITLCGQVPRRLVLTCADGRETRAEVTEYEPAE